MAISLTAAAETRIEIARLTGEEQARQALARFWLPQFPEPGDIEIEGRSPSELLPAIVSYAEHLVAAYAYELLNPFPAQAEYEDALDRAVERVVNSMLRGHVPQSSAPGRSADAEGTKRLRDTLA
jgi:hypothetical protein